MASVELCWRCWRALPPSLIFYFFFNLLVLAFTSEPLWADVWPIARAKHFNKALSFLLLTFFTSVYEQLKQVENGITYWLERPHSSARLFKISLYSLYTCHSILVYNWYMYLLFLCVDHEFEKSFLFVRCWLTSGLDESNENNEPFWVWENIETFSFLAIGCDWWFIVKGARSERWQPILKIFLFSFLIYIFVW